MSLSAHQIEVIDKTISENGISISTLYDDVLDHLCCAVEYKIDDGISFEIALQEAIEELAPEGLDKIQQETLVLLNFKTIYMKKVMYVIGLIATISLSMGTMFKLLHMPGGEQLLNFGFFAFTLLFLPLYAYDRFQFNQFRTSYEKWQLALGGMSALAIVSAIVLKMMYLLPPAEFLFIAGTSIFSLGFLPVLFLNLYRSNSLKSIS